MRTAGLYGGQHPSAGGAAALLESTEAAAAKLLHSVKGIPTNPERRVKQAVYLAQRLLEAERQRDAMQAELKKAKADLAVAQKQAEVAAENLTRAAQPTAYLVNKLRDEENAKTTFLAKCKALEEEARRSRQAELASRKEAQQLRERLQSLLQQRGELETVKLMLAQLSALEAEEEDTDSSNEGSDGSEDEGSRAGRRVGFSGAAAEEQKRNSLSPASSSHSSQHSQRGGGGKSPVAMAAPSTPSKMPGASLSSTAAALGLTPEQVKEMTSPPKR
jgi:chromosome segregation ATPase